MGGSVGFGVGMRVGVSDGAGLQNDVLLRKSACVRVKLADGVRVQVAVRRMCAAYVGSCVGLGDGAGEGSGVGSNVGAGLHAPIYCGL